MTNNSTTLQYIPLQEDHLNAIMPIEKEAYPDPWTKGMFRQEIRSDKSRFYVILIEDELVAYGGFWLVLDEAHITSITVKQQHRGQGLGAKLLSFLLELALQEGASIATLEVRETNQVARNLYEHFGFDVIGFRKGYYVKNNENAVIMLKTL